MASQTAELLDAMMETVKAAKWAPTRVVLRVVLKAGRTEHYVADYWEHYSVASLVATLPPLTQL